MTDGLFFFLIGKQGDKANEGKVSPNNMKKVRFSTKTFDREILYG